MRLSGADFVPLLTIVAGGVIGASFTFGALVSRSPADDVPMRSPADDVPMRSPDGKSSVFDECAAAIRLLGWVDRCPDVRVDGFDGEVDLSAAPMFTPMTVRPEIRNRSEVQAALTREYPPILRDAGIGGTVVVWFFITEDGVSPGQEGVSEFRSGAVRRGGPRGRRRFQIFACSEPGPKGPGLD